MAGLPARVVTRLAPFAGIEVLLSNFLGPQTLSELAGELGDRVAAARSRDVVR